MKLPILLVLTPVLTENSKFFFKNTSFLPIPIREPITPPITVPSPGHIKEPIKEPAVAHAIELRLPTIASTLFILNSWESISPTAHLYP